LSKIRRWLRRVVLLILALVLGFHAACAASLLILRWMDPPVTAVQVQRQIEAWWGRKPYTRRCTFVPLERIPRDLQHAVIAAEDGRFYQHHGIDWRELRKAADKNLKEGRIGRGASTITQQLVKNLFFTTSRSGARKLLEFSLAPLAELILPKRRILCLYLNVIEWGPGVYGAEAAARYHYGVSAARLNREQAARLAAVIPSPRSRRPTRMDGYSAEILARMTRMGW